MEINILQKIPDIHQESASAPVTSKKDSSVIRKIQIAAFNFLERPKTPIAITYHSLVYALSQQILFGIFVLILFNLIDDWMNEKMKKMFSNGKLARKSIKWKKEIKMQNFFSSKYLLKTQKLYNFNLPLNFFFQFYRA